MLMLGAPYRPKICSTGHLRLGFEPKTNAGIVEKACTHLAWHDFDAIAFRGLSGALIAPIIAHEMGKTLLAVRRPNEHCHSGFLVEGDYAARRYVIVDDFISSGTTVRMIMTEIQRVIPARCIGVYEYLYPHHPKATCYLRGVADVGLIGKDSSFVF